MIKFEEFTGGVFDTNAFLLRGPAGNILIDAPAGADKRFADEPIHTLLLTHGHFDHIIDAAAIQKRHGCQIAIHRDSAPMLTEPGFFLKWGFQLDVISTDADIELADRPALEVAGLTFELFNVPGHCPGSVCFYLRDDGILFAGDTLFAGGVGRWDLPGGDHDLLISKINEHILTLPDDTQVFPGHGPATTVAGERLTNPFLNGSQ